MESRKIEISTGIIFRTILILLCLWFIFLVRDVLLLLIISVIIVAAIEPAVDYLQKKKVPRSLSVLAIYVLLFALIGGALSLLVPPIINQFQDFSANYPQYSQKFRDSVDPIRNFIEINHINFSSDQLFSEFGSGVTDFTRNIFSKTIGVFTGFVSIIVVLSLTFYMSVKEDAITHFVGSITPENHRKYAVSLTNRIKEKIGKWLLGQFFLMFLIAIFDFIGLSIIGVPYALILAIFAGVMEIVPYIGPIISAVPGVLLGFMVSPTVGVLALVVYIVAQQFENHVVVPQVMKKAVGLNPIAVILALMVGAKIAGTLGAILAIPVATAVSLFLGDLMNERNKES
jgi:predicted PurR-regulated permease PerM